VVDQWPSFSPASSWVGGITVALASSIWYQTQFRAGWVGYCLTLSGLVIRSSMDHPGSCFVEVSCVQARHVLHKSGARDKVCIPGGRQGVAASLPLLRGTAAARPRLEEDGSRHLICLSPQACGSPPHGSVSSQLRQPPDQWRRRRRQWRGSQSESGPNGEAAAAGRRRGSRQCEGGGFEDHATITRHTQQVTGCPAQAGGRCWPPPPESGASGALPWCIG